MLVTLSLQLPAHMYCTYRTAAKNSNLPALSHVETNSSKVSFMSDIKNVRGLISLKLGNMIESNTHSVECSKLTKPEERQRDNRKLASWSRTVLHDEIWKRRQEL